MRRREFIAAAPGLLGVAASPMPRAIKLPPLGRLVDPRMYIVTPSNPAAGQGLQWTVPSNLCVELIAFCFAISNTAVAGGRVPFLTASWNGLALWRIGASSSIAPSNTLFVTFDTTAVNVAVANNQYHIACGRMILPPDTLIQLAITAMDAGDQINTPVFTFLAYALE